MQAEYMPPQFESQSFCCPHCGVLAEQVWYEIVLAFNRIAQTTLPDAGVVKCHRCSKISIWHQKTMVFPDGGNAPLPHPDMPADVAEDFNEARSIVSKSPKGAAGLLRLAIQKLMPHLGEPGKTIDDDIASLVKKGLPIRIQQALDTVRVVGNEAVHPGQIDLNDKPEIAQALFGLVNVIVDVMIAQPKHINTLYQSLPASKLQGIQARAKKT